MAKEYMMFFATFCIQAYRCTFCRICWLLLAFVYITRAFFLSKNGEHPFFEGLDQPQGRQKKFQQLKKSSSQIQKPSHHLAGRGKLVAPRMRKMASRKLGEGVKKMKVGCGFSFFTGSL